MNLNLDILYLNWSYDLNPYVSMDWRRHLWFVIRAFLYLFTGGTLQAWSAINARTISMGNISIFKTFGGDSISSKWKYKTFLCSTLISRERRLQWKWSNPSTALVLFSTRKKRVLQLVKSKYIAFCFFCYSATCYAAIIRSDTTIDNLTIRGPIVIIQ